MVSPLIQFFDALAMKLYDVQKIDNKGGIGKENSPVQDVSVGGCGSNIDDISNGIRDGLPFQ